MKNRLEQKYKDDVIPALQSQFHYANTMSVPKIQKVVINIGIGRAAREKDTKTIERIEKDLMKITGQKPSMRKAKQSISGFKLRQGSVIGMAITLRGSRMYDFIDRLISIALPRSRDFHGLNAASFDKNGNLNIGLKEHIIFPEVAYESLRDIFGFQITVTTTAQSAAEGRALLQSLGFPLAA